MSQCTLLSLLPGELIVDILAGAEARDLQSLFACNKELHLLVIPHLEDAWLSMRTDIQLQNLLMAAVDRYRHDIITKILKQPALRAKVGRTALAAAFLHAVRIRREVATLMLPFCQCSIKKTALDVIKHAMEHPTTLNLTSCDVQVHDAHAHAISAVISRPLLFTANMTEVRSGSIDCVQWPLWSKNVKEGITFWLGPPEAAGAGVGADDNEWASVSTSIFLEHQWLRFRCDGVPAT